MKSNESKIGGHGRKFIPVYDSRNRRVAQVQNIGNTWCGIENNFEF